MSPLSQILPENNVIVPSVEEVEAFLLACKKQGIKSFDYPTIDDRWRKSIDTALQQAEMSLRYGDSFFLAAGKLFCKINMGHKLIDGNKRTSIITVVFFLFVNDYFLSVQREDLKEFAKKIAQRRNSMFERAAEDACKFISENTIPLAELEGYISK